MLRALPALPLLALAGCATAAAETATAPSPSTAQLFRGGQAETRLRCGSESLRARLRQGQLLVQVGSGENAVLVPRDDPRARPGEAYGDGRLTLYRAPGGEGWMLARTSAPGAAARCSPDPGAP
jgi:hypothetical protein